GILIVPIRRQKPCPRQQHAAFECFEHYTLPLLCASGRSTTSGRKPHRAILRPSWRSTQGRIRREKSKSESKSWQRRKEVGLGEVRIPRNRESHKTHELTRIFTNEGGNSRQVCQDAKSARREISN